MERIEISGKTWELIKRSAEPYVDKTPDDTLRRVLQSYLAVGEEKTMENSAKSKGSDLLGGPSMVSGPERRAPRERGARVMLDGENIVAVSVHDLYEQALKMLVKKHRAKLKSILPFATSSDRFLVAEAPKHPSGRSFVVPAEYDGFFMESHKDYKNALAHLGQLADRIGIKCEYLGR